MQHRIPRITTIAALCTITLAGHAALYGVWRRDVRGIVREELTAELQPVRDELSRAHDRIDQHLARQP